MFCGRSGPSAPAHARPISGSTQCEEGCMSALRSRNDRVKFATCLWGLFWLAACEHELTDDRTVAAADESLRNAPARVREFIAQQIGGIDKLQVPADDSSIPLPPEDPERPGRYKTTEA